MGNQAYFTRLSGYAQKVPSLKSTCFFCVKLYNCCMSSIIQFTIKKDEDGVYCARAVDFPIFTFGKTLPELEKNVQEATDLYLKDENLSSIGLSSAKPSLLANFEISRTAYA